MSDLIKEQAPPRESSGDVWLMVLADMEARRVHGIEKYGMPVQPGNGRDPLMDAYQECLDLCVYLRQAIEERKRTAQSETPLLVLYTNHRGETSVRRIIPKILRYGSSEWHPGEQWLLDALDVDKGEMRTFAMAGFGSWPGPK